MSSVPGRPGTGTSGTLAVRKNSSLVGTRSRVNLIEGSNVTLTVADDGTEIDVTIAASGGGSGISDGTYADVTVSGGGTTFTVTKIGGVAVGTAATVNTGTGSGNVPTIAQADARYAAASHTHAQSDITNLTTDLAAKAPIASPALTGTPTAPTAAAGANTTQIATTAFVAASYAGRALALPFALP